MREVGVVGKLWCSKKYFGKEDLLGVATRGFGDVCDAWRVPGIWIAGPGELVYGRFKWAKWPA